MSDQRAEATARDESKHQYQNSNELSKVWIIG
jgi:hypothetical protein